MWMDHLRAWFLGQPVQPESPTKPREQRDAQRAAAACGPKPLAEAVGDALSAVGELVASLQASKKKKGAGKKSPAKKRARRASTPRAASSSTASPSAASSSSRRGVRRAPVATREVVVVEEVVVQPRTGARAKATRGRTSRRSRATIVADAPIIVAPERAAVSPSEEGAERA